MMLAVTLASLLAIACGGSTTAPVEPGPADATPVQLVTVPEGYRVATKWESGAQSVYKRPLVGILAPDASWWYGPQEGLVEDAGEQFAVVTDTSGAFYVDCRDGKRVPESGTYLSANKFSEGRAWAQSRDAFTDSALDEPAFGFVLIDERGKVVKAYKDEVLAVEDFAGGLAAAQTGERDPDDADHDEWPVVRGPYGYLAKDGSWAISAKYDAAWSFEAGTARVTLTDGRHVTIDPKGAETGTWTP